MPNGKFNEALHEETRQRELEIVAAIAPEGLEATHAALAADRATRWAELLAARTELGAITEWAKRMAVKYGLTCRVWRTGGLSWIAGLYIVRYGEAESYWPAKLTLEDLARAKQLERGVSWPDSLKTEQAPEAS
jgi:hypothetical protein